MTMLRRQAEGWDPDAGQAVKASHLVSREGKDQDRLHRVCDGEELGGTGQWGMYGRQYFVNPLIHTDVLPVTDYIDDDIQCESCRDARFDILVWLAVEDDTINLDELDEFSF